MSEPVPVFDGHNDAVLRLWRGGMDGVEDRWRAAESGHLDLEKAKVGGFEGGFFAIFVPGTEPFDDSILDNPPYDIALPAPIGQDDALRVVVEQAGVLLRLQAEGLLRVCTSSADIEASIASGTTAAIMHIEGAEALDPELRALDALYAMGLRSIGPVWSRPTAFGHGVPFRFPSDGDIGGGLTDAGMALAAECLKWRIVFDTSHLNVKGFEDAGEAGLPLVATHSNAHAVAPSARNLTDAQLSMIAESGGMVGLNFGTVFLNPDGSRTAETALDAAMRHLDHMISLAGEDAVGLGSDFDGAPMPSGLGSAAELPNLARRMERFGFGKTLTEKIFSRNWRDFLARYWDR